MVWKSNLADVDQEVIEDLGAATQVPTGGAKAPGGISTNRKTKVPAATSTQPRYQNIASAQPYNSNQPPSHNLAQSQHNVFEHTGRSTNTVLVPPAHDANKLEGVTGNSEELAQTLEKMVSQLDIITRTAHVLEQRISMNEESVANVLEYFNEIKQQYAQIRNEKANQGSLAANQNLVNFTMQNHQQTKDDLNLMKSSIQTLSQQAQVLRQQ